MNRSLTIVLSRKMALTLRISEASRQINEWVKSIEVAFNNEREKLQLIDWELSNTDYRYHYVIVKGKELSAGSIRAQLSDAVRATSRTPTAHAKREDPMTDFSTHPIPL